MDKDIINKYKKFINGFSFRSDEDNPMSVYLNMLLNNEIDLIAWSNEKIAKITLGVSAKEYFTSKTGVANQKNIFYTIYKASMEVEYPYHWTSSWIWLENYFVLKNIDINFGELKAFFIYLDTKMKSINVRVTFGESLFMERDMHDDLWFDVSEHSNIFELIKDLKVGDHPLFIYEDNKFSPVFWDWTFKNIIYSITTDLRKNDENIFKTFMEDSVYSELKKREIKWKIYIHGKNIERRVNGKDLEADLIYEMNNIIFVVEFKNSIDLLNPSTYKEEHFKTWVSQTYEKSGTQLKRIVGNIEKFVPNYRNQKIIPMTITLGQNRVNPIHAKSFLNTSLDNWVIGDIDSYLFTLGSMNHPYIINSISRFSKPDMLINIFDWVDWMGLMISFDSKDEIPKIRKIIGPDNEFMRTVITYYNSNKVYDNFSCNFLGDYRMLIPIMYDSLVAAQPINFLLHPLELELLKTNKLSIEYIKRFFPEGLHKNGDTITYLGNDFKI